MMLRHAVGHLSRFLLLGGGLLLGVMLTVSAAQVSTAIRPDGTLGTTVTQSGSIYTIMGGTRPGNGPNLFHSFDRFSVGTGDTARFSGSTGIQNILSRVTGGQQSLIDGRLQSTIPGANLYLLNPSGVLFGPNARLNVRGSFHVSTADYLRLADGATFSAHLGEKSTLTIASPVAFGFLGSMPAPITIQSSALEVSEGRALSVIGGDVQIVEGTLTAPSGRIQLVSVASPGEVHFSSLESAPNLQVDSFTRLGRLELSQGTLIDASGLGEPGSGGPGGTVLIRSGRLLVDRSTIQTFTLGAMDGAGLGIDLRVTESIDLAGQGTLSGLASATLGAGRAGDIYVKAGKITVTGGAQILGTTAGGGQGGNMTVIAEDALVLAGASSDGVFPSALATNTLDKGHAGNLFVSAPTVTVDGGIIQALTTADGDAGAITLQTDSLSLTGGAQISSSSSATDLRTGQLQVARGQGGDMTITATRGITIAGRDSAGFPSGLFTDTDGSGNAGHMSISTPVLQMNGGRITSATHGDGRAGDLVIEVGSLTLAGGAQIASASGVQQDDGTIRVGSGRGGNLTIMAREGITIAGRDPKSVPSTISATTFGSGNAGNIFISASALSVEGVRGVQAGTSGSGQAGDIEVKVGNLSLTGGASIDTGTADTGRGGNVRITATDLISISGRDSEGLRSGIASETLGPGRGGDIALQAQRIALSDGGVTARSTGSGAAGTIRIQAGDTFASQGGTVTTAAEQSGGGQIELRGGRLVQLRDSEVTTSVRGGGGDAGNLTVDAPFIVASGSQVVAQAFGGRGGNIQLTADVFLADPATQVSASSTLGISGSVDIRAPVTNLSGVVAPLSPDFARATALLQDRCAARLREGTVSTFMVRGRPSPSVSYDRPLPSRLYTPQRQPLTPAEAGSPSVEPPAAPQGLLPEEAAGRGQETSAWALPGSPLVLALPCAR
jgi:filamentous hemagglutinin family protein